MIDENIKSLAQANNFAAFTTLLPDGQPMTHIMWVDADDEHVLINTEVGRQKALNVKRDPRVTVTVIDAANPYRYGEVRGTVVEQETGPAARAHIDKLSLKYTGKPYDPNAIKTERILLRIAPERQRSNG
jgi:PPOX class probable F420-dependent enzyme